MSDPAFVALSGCLELVRRFPAACRGRRLVVASQSAVIVALLKGATARNSAVAFAQEQMAIVAMRLGMRFDPVLRLAAEWAHCRGRVRSTAPARPDEFDILQSVVDKRRWNAAPYGDGSAYDTQIVFTEYELEEGRGVRLVHDGRRILWTAPMSELVAACDGRSVFAVLPLSSVDESKHLWELWNLLSRAYFLVLICVPDNVASGPLSPAIDAAWPASPLGPSGTEWWLTWVCPSRWILRDILLPATNAEWSFTRISGGRRRVVQTKHRWAVVVSPSATAARMQPPGAAFRAWTPP